MKNKQYWHFIIPIAVMFLYWILGFYCVDDFFMGTASDSHIALAMTISTSVLIGGCLLLFVENQHVESEIASRYHSVMRPFYHRFTQFIKIISKFVLSIRSEDEEGRKIKEDINKKTEELCRMASRSIVSGDEPHYIKAALIDELCEQINDVWQPVQNVPYSYENFIKKVESCKLYFTVSIAIEVVCVILLLLSDASGLVSICLCDTLVLIALLSFLVCLYKFQKLKLKSVITAF